MTTTVLTSSGREARELERRYDVDPVLECAAVHDVTHDVRSFVLRQTGPTKLRFQPGQHLTLTVDLDGQQVSRCYTISSSPLHPEDLTITVKRVPGGPVSNWLHDRLRPGDLVSVDGPLGRFSNVNHPAQKYLFLSAGSGITPLMSMLRTIHGEQQPVDVVFVHHARTPADIIFRNELRVIEAEHTGVRVLIVCEDDAADERWTGSRGRVALPMLLDFAPDLLDREIFTCGPPPYMAAVRDALARAGAQPRRCHEESFDLGPRAVSPTPVRQPSTRSAYSVELQRTGRTIECDGGTTLLDAAEDAGISLPSSCQEGVCGTCKTTLVSGRVEMNHAGGIRPREVAEQKILLCCSTPCEDVVIDA